MPRTCIVALDGSEYSERIVSAAHTVAQQADAALELHQGCFQTQRILFQIRNNLLQIGHRLFERDLAA